MLKLLKIKGSGNIKKGFALVTVLLMSALLLMLMVSLINLTTQTLYRATVDVERSSVMCVAETAINEAILKIKDSGSYTWGEHKEKLYMCTGGQDIKIAGLDPSGVGSPSSGLSFQGKACYYITFDKNDGGFASGSTKYYSVNNLNGDSAVTGCRGTVPPHSASIIATVAVGSTVRHVEVIIQNAPGWKMQNGSRGKVFIDTNLFELESVSGESPNFHSNYNDSGTDDSIVFTDMADSLGKTFKTDLSKGATVSGVGLINSPGTLDPNEFIENAGTKNVPVLPVSDLISGISFVSTIPSGTYKVNGTSLEYFADGKDPLVDSPDATYSDNTTFATGVKFKDKKLEISENIQIAFDPLAPTAGSSGNLFIDGAGLKFSTDASIYAPGDGTREYPTTSVADPTIEAPYMYGNVEVIDSPSSTKKVVEGKGCVYALGEIYIDGYEINAGQTSEDIALCAQGDISLITKDDTLFRGLVYTEGDFFCRVEKTGSVKKKKGKRKHSGTTV